MFPFISGADEKNSKFTEFISNYDEKRKKIPSDTDVIESNSFDELRRALLMNIEKYETPKIDDTTYTDIKISAKIHHIDIQDDQGAMNAHGFLKMVSNKT